MGFKNAARNLLGAVMATVAVTAMAMPASAASAVSYYTLRPANSGLCLDVVNGSTSNGARIQQWDCNNLSQQSWYLGTAGDVFTYYYLKNKKSGKCLEVKDGSNADGAPFQQWTCNVSGRQQQRFNLSSRDGNVSYRLETYSSGQISCADITGGPGAIGNGVRLQQWTCLGYPTNQRFYFI